MKRIIQESLMEAFENVITESNDEISRHISDLLKHNEAHTQEYLKSNRGANSGISKGADVSPSIRRYSDKVTKEASEFAKAHKTHAKEAGELVDKLKKVSDSGGTLTDEHKKQIEEFKNRSNDLYKKSRSAEYRNSLPENNHAPSAASDEHHNLYNKHQPESGHTVTLVHPDAEEMLHPDNRKNQKNPKTGPGPRQKATSTATSSSSSSSSSQSSSKSSNNVPPRPKPSYSNTHMAWDAKHGLTHNPDGTPKKKK